VSDRERPPPPASETRSEGTGGVMGGTGISQQDPVKVRGAELLNVDRAESAKVRLFPGPRENTGLEKTVLRLVKHDDWRKMREDLRPHAASAAEQLDATMQQVAEVTGECGPIEAASLRTAAWQTVYGEWLMAEAAKTGDVGKIQAAAKLLDFAERNRRAAYDLAVRIARGKPPEEPKDVLDAFMPRKK